MKNHYNCNALHSNVTWFVVFMYMTCYACKLKYNYIRALCIYIRYFDINIYFEISLFVYYIYVAFVSQQ